MDKVKSTILYPDRQHPVYDGASWKTSLGLFAHARGSRNDGTRPDNFSTPGSPPSSNVAEAASLLRRAADLLSKP